MAVTKEAIIDAAIGILNRDGAEGLSMRTLAKALNIKAASLYNHISGKRELFGAVAEFLCSRFDMPESSLPPVDFLAAAYRTYRTMLLEVRDSTVIFEHSLPDTPRRVEIIRTITEKLLALGIPKENLMTLSNMLNNYVLSFAADEWRFKHTPPELIAAFTHLLDPDEGVTFINERDYDKQFDYGLDLIFAGLERQKTWKYTP